MNFKCVPDIDFDYDVKIWNYMYRNPEGKWINTLLDIYGDITGNEAKPV